MNPWEGWSADDWVRHYAGEPASPQPHATGASVLDQAQQAAQRLFERGERGLQRLVDAPDRVVSAVEMEADRAARRARQLLDEEGAKVEKPLKIAAMAALAIFGVLALEKK